MINIISITEKKYIQLNGSCISFNIIIYNIVLFMLQYYMFICTNINMLCEKLCNTSKLDTALENYVHEINNLYLISTASQPHLLAHYNISLSNTARSRCNSTKV